MVRDKNKITCVGTFVFLHKPAAKTGILNTKMSHLLFSSSFHWKDGKTQHMRRQSGQWIGIAALTNPWMGAS